MTMNEVIAEIQRGLGYRSDKTDEIKSKLRLAQDELERGKTLPWFIVNEDETISLTAGVSTWTLPNNFIREVDDFGNPNSQFSSDGDIVNLKRLPYDVGYSTYGGADPGEVVAYSKRGSSFVFWPTPDEDTELTISYYAHADDPSTAASNVWSENVPGLLIGLAGMMIAADLHDDAAQQKFAVQYAQAKDSLFKEIVADEDANMQFSLGGLL